ncbi:MAG: hypothetical protein ABFS32_16155 [Bacteroidota bacterium]
MKKFLFAILAVAVLFTACEKDEDFVDVDQLKDLTITDYNGFSGLTVVREENGDLVYDVKYEYDAAVYELFNSVKLYYTVNCDFTDAEWTQAVADDDEGIEPNLLADNRVSLEIEDPADDNMYSFTIPAAEVNKADVLRLYFRGYAKDTVLSVKNKMYYSPTGNDTFDHDVYSQWTVLTVK